VHLLSGAVALGCVLGSVAASRLYFRIFGIVYGLFAVLGFVQGETLLLGLISNNTADVWLHVAIAVASLALGFGVRGALAAGVSGQARSSQRSQHGAAGLGTHYLYFNGFHTALFPLLRQFPSSYRRDQMPIAVVGIGSPLGISFATWARNHCMAAPTCGPWNNHATLCVVSSSMRAARCERLRPQGLDRAEPESLPFCTSFYTYSSGYRAWIHRQPEFRKSTRFPWRKPMRREQKAALDEIANRDPNEPLTLIRK
jgi:Domain of unknown function (DUF4383)